MADIRMGFEWDLNGIWNGLTTDLQRTYNGIISEIENDKRQYG